MIDSLMAAPGGGMPGVVRFRLTGAEDWAVWLYGRALREMHLPN
ncbi:hypothetical protein GCM10010129_14810 [Streptomyces fumigatiscleroticus]|nr:hypothetical protein GCM10010129_14810 [Streptomyces fumigatiscleroticus]